MKLSIILMQKHTSIEKYPRTVVTKKVCGESLI